MSTAGKGKKAAASSLPLTHYCFCRTTDTTRFMIACDQCGEWFHGDCVNVSPDAAKSIEKYYCYVCKALKNAQLLQTQNMVSFTDQKQVSGATTATGVGVATMGIKRRRRKRTSVVPPATLTLMESGLKPKEGPQKQGGNPATGITPAPATKERNHKTAKRSASSVQPNSSGIELPIPSPCVSTALVVKNEGLSINTSSKHAKKLKRNQTGSLLKTSTHVAGRKKKGNPIEEFKFVSQAVVGKRCSLMLGEEKPPANSELSSDNSCKMEFEIVSEAEYDFLLDLNIKSTGNGGGLPAICFRPGCFGTVSVPDSKFCSDKCNEISCIHNLRQLFSPPPNIHHEDIDTNAVPTIEIWTNLTEVRQNLHRCCQNLHLLGRRRLGLGVYLENLVYIKPAEGDDNAGIVDSDVFIRCVICSKLYKMKYFVKHVKFCLKENRGMFESRRAIFSASVVGPSIFCCTHSPEKKYCCTKLKVLCDKHNLATKISTTTVSEGLANDRVCGYPMKWDKKFETYDWALMCSNERKYCRRTKGDCKVHSNWETIMCVDLDIRRYVQVDAVQKLREMDRENWKRLPDKQLLLDSLLAIEH